MNKTEPLLQINIVQPNKSFTCNKWEKDPSIFVRAKGVVLWPNLAKSVTHADNELQQMMLDKIPITNIFAPSTIEMNLRDYGMEMNFIDLNAVTEITSQSGKILLTLEKEGYLVECICSRIYTYPEDNTFSKYSPRLHIENLYFLCGGEKLKSNNIELVKKIAECKERKNNSCFHRICDNFVSSTWGLLCNWGCIKSIQSYGEVTVNGHSKWNNWSNALVCKNGKWVKAEPGDISPIIFEGCSSDGFSRHFSPPYNILFETYISDSIKYIKILISYEEKSSPHFVRGEGLYQECTVWTYHVESYISFPSMYDLYQYAKAMDSLGYKIPYPEIPFTSKSFHSSNTISIDKSIRNIAVELDVTFTYRTDRYEEPA